MMALIAPKHNLNMNIGKNKHLEDEVINEEESSSSEDDENAEQLTENLEKGFFKILSRLKKNDSKLYNENTSYFTPEDSKVDDKKNHQKQEYKEWLKGQKKKINDPEIEEELEGLHDFWTNPNINKEDQFLRDYILNKKFLDHDESFNLDEELEKLSDLEKEEEEEAIFEEKYNSRFEKPDDKFLQKYPETMKKASGEKTNLNNLTEKEENKKSPFLKGDTKNKLIKDSMKRSSINEKIQSTGTSGINKTKFKTKTPGISSLQKKKLKKLKNGANLFLSKNNVKDNLSEDNMNKRSDSDEKIKSTDTSDKKTKILNTDTTGVKLQQKKLKMLKKLKNATDKLLFKGDHNGKLSESNNIKVLGFEKKRKSSSAQGIKTKVLKTVATELKDVPTFKKKTQRPFKKLKNVILTVDKKVTETKATNAKTKKIQNVDVVKVTSKISGLQNKANLDRKTVHLKKLKIKEVGKAKEQKRWKFMKKYTNTDIKKSEKKKKNRKEKRRHRALSKSST